MERMESTLRLLFIPSISFTVDHALDMASDALSVLADLNTREGVFMLWIKVVTSLGQDSEALLRAVHWLSHFYMIYPVPSIHLRMCLFSTLEKCCFPSLTSSMSIPHAFKFQPSRDVFEMILAGPDLVKEWVAKPITEKDAVADAIRHRDIVWRCEFVPPRLILVKQLSELLNDTCSRSDVFVTSLDIMEEIAVEVNSVYGQSKTRNNEQALHNLYARIEWISKFLSRIIKKSPPSPLIYIDIHKRVMKIVLTEPSNCETRIQSDDTNSVNLIWSMSVESSLRQLASHVIRVGCSIIENMEINTNIRLLSDQKDKEYRKIQRVQMSIQAEKRMSYTNTIELEEPLQQALSDTPVPLYINKHDIVYVASRVWLQIDPKGNNRIVMKAWQIDSDYKNEILSSISSGTLFFLSEKLMWLDTSSKDEQETISQCSAHSSPISEEKRVELELCNLVRFSFGKINVDEIACQYENEFEEDMHDEEYDAATAYYQTRFVNENRDSKLNYLNSMKETARGRIASIRKKTVSRMNVSDNIRSAATLGNVTNITDVSNLEALRKQPDLYYISLHFGEVYKFYPFQEEEVHQLVNTITQLTGQAPFDENSFIKFVLSDQLDSTRMSVLKNIEYAALISGHSPWIQHSMELQKVIKSLTTENRSQSITDMERLFHSCRLEQEVTKEAIHLLRKTWKDTQSEQVRLKVLGVVDRLLDRAIMHPRYRNFTKLVQWLQALEKVLDPYKNADTLGTVLKLINRAGFIKENILTPLTQELPVLFDFWEEYLKFRDSKHSTMDSVTLI